jgi:hypothetical protein
MGSDDTERFVVPKKTRKAASGLPTPFRTITAAMVVGVAALVGVATGATMMMAGADAAPPPAAASAPMAGVPNMAHTTTDIRGFLTDYYALLPTDTEQAWSMLSATYQAKVGGFASFQGFYDLICTVRVREVRLTGAGTAAAILVFTRTDGTTSVETYQFTISTRGGVPMIEDARLSKVTGS